MKKVFIILSAIIGLLFLIYIDIVSILGTSLDIKYTLEYNHFESDELDISVIYRIFNILSAVIIINLTLFVIALFRLFKGKKVKKIYKGLLAFFVIIQLGFIVDKYLFLEYSIHKLDISTIIYNRIYPMTTALSWLIIINLILFLITLIIILFRKIKQKNIDKRN